MVRLYAQSKSSPPLLSHGIGAGGGRGGGGGTVAIRQEKGVGPRRYRRERKKKNPEKCDGTLGWRDPDDGHRRMCEAERRKEEKKKAG